MVTLHANDLSGCVAYISDKQLATKLGGFQVNGGEESPR